MLHSCVFMYSRGLRRQAVKLLRDRAAAAHVVYAYNSGIWEAKAGESWVWNQHGLACESWTKEQDPVSEQQQQTHTRVGPILEWELGNLWCLRGLQEILLEIETCGSVTFSWREKACIEQTLKVTRANRTKDEATNPAKIVKRSSQRVRGTSVPLETGSRWKRLFRGHWGERLCWGSWHTK